MRRTPAGLLFVCVASQPVLDAGFRPRRRDTFLCVAKEKYPKERPPGRRLFPPLLAFIGRRQKVHPCPSAAVRNPFRTPSG